MRKFPDRIDENGVTHTGESSETEKCMVCHEKWDKTNNRIDFQLKWSHEICTTCATQWFVQQNKNSCPLCRVRVNVANLKEQIGIIENKIEIPEVFEAICKNNLDKINTYVEQGGDIHEILDTYDDEDGIIVRYSNPLTYACMRNQPEIVKYLVDTCAEVDEAHSENGYTPLHYAVINNSFDIVYILLRYHAAVNPEAYDGVTPFHRTLYCSKYV